ncbi:TlpA family protein disulfide reductase [Telmatocola sphagniphila]|uniref:TlpA family protein disulfide reductase n=1 Tax=Telmatocola sphagniphila TaxID=1123043 RepID=A0A8E6BC71_9BACT|nr:TlpA disulfide reductase family protein [Telmatocola sphagniphila]QVL34488.1 TlpA family protein disulfide reductase [Telmatocola sphagniphila]
MWWYLTIFVLMSLGLACSSAPVETPVPEKHSVESKEPAPKLEKVTFEQFEKAVAGYKGQVVIVDVWGEFCIPCKKKFPSIMQMNKDLAKLGVVFMTVSRDEAENEKAVLEFLTKQKALIPNFILVDSEENIQEGSKRIDVTVPPQMHVFNRLGKLVKTFDNKNKEAEVEKFIRDLAEKK